MGSPQSYPVNEISVTTDFLVSHLPTRHAS
jgi:hypothetical protein